MYDLAHNDLAIVFLLLRELESLSKMTQGL